MMTLPLVARMLGSLGRRSAFAVAVGVLAVSNVSAGEFVRGNYTYDSANQLFTGAYREILEFYLDPVSLEALALAGMAGLDTADRSFSVSEAGHMVVFSDQGRLVSSLPAPEPGDSEGWANVTAAAIITGRSHSSELSSLSDEATYQRIFDGLVAKLDRFTRYAGRYQAGEQRASRDGFGGIGVTLDYTDPLPRISSVVAGGPSVKSGILVDDRLVAIDGVAINRLNQHDVVERLRGPLDSHVIVTVQRAQHEKPLVFTVSRGLIVQPTVTTDMVDDIAVFHIESFNVSTASDLALEIHKARASAKNNLRGAVLDLRDNPGGLLDQAAAVASLFLDHGKVVSTRGRHPTAAQFFQASSEDHLRGLPMVVLVNGGSASASEIVAAALQDNSRAVVVGSSSYGKGTVQMVLRLENAGELTLTWARLIAPSGYLLHTHGVIPTFCTDQPVDPLAQKQEHAAEIDRIVDHGLHPDLAEESQPRASLTEAGWKELRNACPPDSRSASIDIDVAERVLGDAGVFNRALLLSPENVAHAGQVAAPVLH